MLLWEHSGVGFLNVELLKVELRTKLIQKAYASYKETSLGFLLCFAGLPTTFYISSYSHVENYEV